MVTISTFVTSTIAGLIFLLILLILFHLDHPNRPKHQNRHYLGGFEFAAHVQRLTLANLQDWQGCRPHKSYIVHPDRARTP